MRDITVLLQCSRMPDVRDLRPQVNVSVTLQYDRKITFPSVTFCNLNPVKSSLLSTEPELYSLLGDSRRRRSVDNSGRTSR